MMVKSADEIRLQILKKAEFDKEKQFKLCEAYDKIVTLAKRYIDMEEDYYHVIATWLVATYKHNTFPAFPYLYINAMRGSAKTRTLKFISSLGAKGNGQIQNSLTEAVLFRIAPGTTTCLDEAEQINSKDKQTFREVLNSCYKKGMVIKRMRKVKTANGEQQIAENFEPYFPLAIANIWGMEEVLSDRSITLQLEKSNNPAITKMIENFDSLEFQEIKRTLEHFSDDGDDDDAKKEYIEGWNNYITDKYTSSLTSLSSSSLSIHTTSQTPLIDINMLEMFNKIDALDINGRNFELLLPLLLTSKRLSEEHFDRFLVIGKKIMTEKKADEYTESKDVSLYDFIANCLVGSKEFHSIKSLTMEFRLFCGEQQQDDRWLNERWMGHALKRLKLIVEKRKTNSGAEVILNFCKAKEKIGMFKEKKE
jgi:hypothetical protein